MKKYLYSVVALVVALTATSCTDFLDRAPQDALSPSTFWKTESDAKLALTGCYNGLDKIYHNGHWTGNACIMMDALSDDYFDFFSWEGYHVLTTGQITPSNNGVADAWWHFSDIRACNEYIEMESSVTWGNEATKKQYLAEARTLRAFLYFFRTQFFGDMPLIQNTLPTPGDAYLPRDSKEKVEEFIEKELSAAIPDLPGRFEAEQGRINKQFAQGLLMRFYLYKNQYAKAEPIAEDIIKNGNLSLSPNYAEMFLTGNQYDNETIFDYSFVANTSREMYADPFVPNGAYGGWSSVVPTVNLLEAFECVDGNPINESDEYNSEYPYERRDPRMRASIIYSGQVHQGYGDGSTKDKVYNTMPRFFDDGKANPDWWNYTGNSTKTGLNLGKYFQSANIVSPSHTTLHFKCMRLAEVILSLAECYIEQNKNLQDAADLINQTKERAYNNNVYGVKAPLVEVKSQDEMRKVLRRERRMELNGEGLRRFDLKRWGILAETFRNLSIDHYDGYLTNEKNKYGDYIAYKTGVTKGEAFASGNFQSFKDYMEWWPISQGQIDVNPNLKQTAGY